MRRLYEENQQKLSSQQNKWTSYNPLTTRLVEVFIATGVMADPENMFRAEATSRGLAVFSYRERERERQRERGRGRARDKVSPKNPYGPAR